MRLLVSTAALAIALICPNAFAADTEGKEKDGEGWVTIFDGTNLDDWKIVENPETFKLVDGALVAKGPRAHAFYVGDVKNHDFKNFELKVDLMTKDKSNGGIYFRTKVQEQGWPEYGREVQVNNTHGDPKKTGSLYNLVNVLEAPAQDNKWFTEHIIVKGDHVTILVDGKKVVDTTIPEEFQGAKSGLGRWPESGTIALQGHDPISEVHYKNIRIKPLD
jgi:hypothetical protein